ncbi:DMT family transporter [Candidatus Borrarchaeum sp.]|uniref:DMT family transporter n=1 Tax=Candidatus Borrarchaeum sp. TaxID=2846742 RepID=UPI00257A4BD4|nr:DMT family transporter [Candidatus Borrarchaeum sp.]
MTEISNVSGIDRVTFTMMMAAVWIYSLGWIVIKIGLNELPPVSFATLRFTIATCLMMVFIGATRQFSAIKTFEKRDWGIFLILGFVGVFLCYVLTFSALTLTTATDGGVLINLDAVFIAILSILFLNEKFTFFKSVGFFAAFLGVILILTQGDLFFGALTSARILGNFLIIASAICWAVFSVIGKTVTDRFEPALVTGLSFAIGAPMLAVLSFSIEDVGLVLAASMISWSCILYLGVANSIATLLFFTCLKRTEEASRVSVFFLLLPIFVPILAFFIIGEIITYFTVLGAILIILGVYFVEHH